MGKTAILLKCPCGAYKKGGQGWSPLTDEETAQLAARQHELAIMEWPCPPCESAMDAAARIAAENGQRATA